MTVEVSSSEILALAKARQEERKNFPPGRSPYVDQMILDAIFLTERCNFSSLRMTAEEYSTLSGIERPLYSTSRVSL